MAQIIDAIYEDGVLKPLEPINVKEHTRLYIIIESVEERKKKIDRIIALARKSIEGLSEEELAVLESARVNKSLFFPDRHESK
ncbi:DUF104 domain-containing protein [Candidatus Poribacteria bacterium]|nr:DUF104 domain-containing protein [Candidatus Poribacteria bacterium]